MICIQTIEVGRYLKVSDPLVGSKLVQKDEPNNKSKIKITVLNHSFLAAFKAHNKKNHLSIYLNHASFVAGIMRLDKSLPAVVLPGYVIGHTRC